MLQLGQAATYSDHMADQLVAAPQQADPWRQAIDDELVLTENCVVDGDDPKTKLRELIDWHVAVALDPAVSQAARDLVASGHARPSDLIADAGIVANDTPPIVVKKLDAAWEDRYGS